jgi:acyl-coenzyme A thioesterase PaaI-like protein
MNKTNTVSASKITLSELMLPSHSNFSGKIHGGYLLSLMDQIAFAYAPNNNRWMISVSFNETLQIFLGISLEVIGIA